MKLARTMKYFPKIGSAFLSTTAVVSIVIGALGLAAFKSIPNASDVIKKEYQVDPGGVLRLDMDRGNIELEAIDDNYVKIELERSARAESSEEADRILKSAHRYEFSKVGDEVSIQSRIDEKWGQKRWRKGPAVKIHLTVRMPRQFDIDFKSGAGNITIMEVNGEVVGRTGAGNILIEDAEGELDVKSGAGNIEIYGELDEATVVTGAGNISVSAIVDKLHATAGTGNVDVELIGQPRGKSKVNTGAGNISLSLFREC